MKNKNIYVIVTYTGTILSKIVRLYTRAEYCHVSVSLDKNLKEMYSFGRLNPYNPFIGGFVHESCEYGTFKRFKKTKAEIYSLKITEKHYNKIKKIVYSMEKSKKIYKFNTLGLFASAFNIKYESENSYYCSEFIKYIIENADNNIKLSKFAKPNDFRYISDLEFVYRGLLRDYNR